MAVGLTAAALVPGVCSTFMPRCNPVGILPGLSGPAGKADSCMPGMTGLGNICEEHQSAAYAKRISPCRLPCRRAGY